MTTITINENTKEGKALLAHLETLKYVKIEKEKSPYSAAFVKKVKSRSDFAQKHPEKLIKVNPKNVWESIL